MAKPAAKPKKATTAAPVDYVKRVGRMKWPELHKLWQRIKVRKTPRWAAGKAMEHLILRAFELGGAEVIWPYRVQLDGIEVEQIDGMVIHNGITCLVESKDVDDNVNVEPLAKLRNQLMRRPAGVVGCVFSSSGFTLPAKTLARFMAPNAVLLWQGPEIEHLLARNDFCGALEKKYRWLVQHGMPDYDTRAEEV